MKRATLIAIVLMLAVATIVYAQGRGPGYLRAGEPCPYGYTQPNPNPGGWWTRVDPTTPQQKEFVGKAARLHEEIRDKQFEIARLKNTQGDPKSVASLEKDVQNLRTELHEYMTDNRELRQQMGPVGPKAGYGRHCRGQAQWQRGDSAQSRGMRQPGMGMRVSPNCQWR